MNEIYLSVIIPAYKESKRIGPTLLDLARYFKDKKYLYEIIVVDDGSPDNTHAVVQGYMPQIPHLRVIRNKVNKGKGYAIKCGMQSAQGQFRVFMDADNSIHIDEVEIFIEKMIEGGHDVAIGSIAFAYTNTIEHNGWHRRLLGTLSKLIIRIAAVPQIYDTQRGFKVFTAKAAACIFSKQKIHRFSFDVEILLIARMHGFSIQELPTTWDNPPGSSVHFRSYIESFVELIHIFLNKTRGYYDAHYQPGQKKPISILRLTREIINIPKRMWHEIIDSQAHLYIKFFNKKMNTEKGEGFSYKGKEFIHHTRLHHSETALYNLNRIEKAFALTTLTVFIIALVINWHQTLLFSVSFITILYFLDLLFSAFLSFRSIHKNPEIKISEEEKEAFQQQAQFPLYTIFCPLYKEWQVVPQFVKAMNALDYPKNRLEILFLLEENDKETIEKIGQESLPAHFRTIVVPHSNPKTKPKAMNYGLKHATGEFLVIYDAEDMPEGDQIKKALIAFSRLPKETICVQAKLNFYNVRQNLLTRMFTAEYSLWFDLMLPGLQSLNVPMPLGGTSNHFKMSMIRELDGWDAFNVTEDCDLGIRIAKRGFKTAIIDSTTYEEANSDMKNWYNQRSRWIKGYIQTYFVHMRDLKGFKGGWRDLLAFQITVGGKIFSMIVNPLFWLITISYFVFRTSIGLFIESFFPVGILYLGVTSFVFGNFLYLYNYMIGCTKRNFDHLTKCAFLIPFYWIGMSIASWKAVYEVIVKPHYWSKTVHGLHLQKVVSSPLKMVRLTPVSFRGVN